MLRRRVSELIFFSSSAVCLMEGWVCIKQTAEGMKSTCFYAENGDRDGSL